MFYVFFCVVKSELFYFYTSESSGRQSYDHPQFTKIMKSLEEYNDIKYSAYRIAFKIFALQTSLKGKYKILCKNYSMFLSQSILLEYHKLKLYSI